MSIIKHNHPGFCDPRRCERLSVDNVDHRSAPLEMKSSVDDFRMTVGLSRFDEVPLDRPDVANYGRPQVNLGLRDLASLNLDGSEIVVETDLSANDARLLAAALSCAADQLDALAVKTP